MTKKYFKISIAVLTLSLAACGSIFGPVEQRKVVSFEINDTSVTLPEANCQANRDDILYVSPMRANAPYDSTKMFYGEKQYELSKYGYSEWAALPTDMLTQSINKKLISACIYKNIANSNALADANFRLITQLISLRQNVTLDNSGHPTGASNSLIIYGQLINLTNNKVVASKVFEEQLQSKPGPEAMVISINQLLTQFNNELVDWLKQHS